MFSSKKLENPDATKEISGTIEKISLHKKVYKIKLATREGIGYVEIMMFRTDYTTRIKKIYRNVLNDIKKQEKELCSISKKTIDYDEADLIIRKLPLFIEGSYMTAYCGYYKDALFIKQFSLRPPLVSDKMNIKIWVKYFDKWITDFMWENGKKKSTKKQQEKKEFPMEYIGAIRSKLKMTLSLSAKSESILEKTMIDELATQVFFDINVKSTKNENQDENENEKNFPKSYFNVFWILQLILKRFNIFSILKHDTQIKCRLMNVTEFTDVELLKIIDYCDDYELFCIDPYKCYLDQKKQCIAYDILEKFAAVQNVCMDLRIKANIVNSIQSLMNSDGHTCIPLDRLLSEVESRMKMFLYTEEQETAFYKVSLEQFIRNFKYVYIYKSNIKNIEWVYLAYVWKKESYIVEKLKDYIDNRDEINDKKRQIEINDYIEEFEKTKNSQLNQKQKDAVFRTLYTQKGANILSGLPGSGKSLVISCIEYVSFFMGRKILLSAPTGKAANRLGKDGCTLHRLLEGNYDENNGVFKFQKNESNQLSADILVIDETSMVDLTMMYNLLQACPSHLSILFVGDCHQLPSISFGDILHSMIKSEKIPYINLTKIYRQGDGSSISLLSKYVVKGVIPSMDVLNDQKETFFIKASQFAQEYITKMAKEIYTKNRDETIILSPMRKGQLGVSSLNYNIHMSMADLMNSRDNFFKANERLMICSNVYNKDSEGLIDVNKSAFNGDMGYLYETEYDADENMKFVIDILDNNRQKVKRISIDREQLELGHACTIHKMQGSEMPYVVLIMNSFHKNMLNRKLLYTAITRAKKKLYIIGDEKAIIHAIQTNAPERYECLSEKLCI